MTTKNVGVKNTTNLVGQKNPVCPRVGKILQHLSEASVVKPYKELRNRLIKRSADIDALVNLTEELLLSVLGEKGVRFDVSPGPLLMQLDMVLLAFNGHGELLDQDFEANDICQAGLALAADFSDRITGRSVGVSMALRLLRELTDTPVTDLVDWLNLRSPAAYLHLEKPNVKRHLRSSRSKADEEAGFFLFAADERQAPSGIKISSLDQMLTGYTRRALSERQGSSLSRLHHCLSSSAAIFATLVHPVAVEIRKAKMDNQLSKSMSWVTPVIDGVQGISVLSHLVPREWSARWGEGWRDRPQSKELELEVFRFDSGDGFGVTSASMWYGELPADVELSDIGLAKRRAVTVSVLTAYLQKLFNQALKQL